MWHPPATRLHLYSTEAPVYSRPGWQTPWQHATSVHTRPHHLGDQQISNKERLRKYWNGKKRKRFLDILSFYTQREDDGWSVTLRNQDVIPSINEYFSVLFLSNGIFKPTVPILHFNAVLPIFPSMPVAFVLVSYPLTNCTVLDGELVPIGPAVCQQVLQPRQLSLQHTVLLLEGHDWGHGPSCRKREQRQQLAKERVKIYIKYDVIWLRADCGHLRLSLRFFVTISRTRAGRHVGGASGEGPRTVSLFSSDKTLSSNLWCAKHKYVDLVLWQLERMTMIIKSLQQTKWHQIWSKAQ